jgi:hypothetical protein
MDVNEDEFGKQKSTLECTDIDEIAIRSFAFECPSLYCNYCSQSSQLLDSHLQCFHSCRLFEELNCRSGSQDDDNRDCKESSLISQTVRRVLDIGLPHDFIAEVLPPSWRFDIHERHDAGASFQVYVSPLGQQVQSVDNLLLQLCESTSIEHKYSPLPPAGICCPIARSIFEDPVVWLDGNSYDRRILEECHDTDIARPVNSLLNALVFDWKSAIDAEFSTACATESMVSRSKADAAKAAPPLESVPRFKKKESVDETSATKTPVKRPRDRSSESYERAPVGTKNILLGHEEKKSKPSSRHEGQNSVGTLFAQSSRPDRRFPGDATKPINYERRPTVDEQMASSLRADLENKCTLKSDASTNVCSSKKSYRISF